MSRRGYIPHEMAYECLWYAHVDAVHRHVVAVVCAPSEGQLAEVAGADDESSHLVADVHENLRALSGLRVLVGDIVDGRVVTDVTEVLSDGLGNVYLADGDAKFAHERHGVVVGAVGSSESRHGDPYDASSVKAEEIEGAHAYQQCECGVESAADAHDDMLCVGVVEAFGESHDLDGEYLLAACRHIAGGGDERMRVDGAQQLPFLLGVAGHLGIDEARLSGYHPRALCVDVGGISPALRAQPLYINLTDDELGGETEPP